MPGFQTKKARSIERALSRTGKVRRIIRLLLSKDLLLKRSHL